MNEKNIKNTLLTFITGFILLLISVLLFQKEKLYIIGLIIVSSVDLTLYIISYSLKNAPLKYNIFIVLELVLIIFLIVRDISAIGAVYGLLIAQLIRLTYKILNKDN